MHRQLSVSERVVRNRFVGAAADPHLPETAIAARIIPCRQIGNSQIDLEQTHKPGRKPPKTRRRVLPPTVAVTATPFGQADSPGAGAVRLLEDPPGGDRYRTSGTVVAAAIQRRRLRPNGINDAILVLRYLPGDLDIFALSAVKPDALSRAVSACDAVTKAEIEAALGRAVSKSEERWGVQIDLRTTELMRS